MRVRELVADGLIEAQGNLRRMRLVKCASAQKAEPSHVECPLLAVSGTAKAYPFIATLDPYDLRRSNRRLLVDGICEAIAYCEGIDVEDGGWLFWDECGAALKPEFLSANLRGRFTVRSGTYRLVAAPNQPSLAEALGGIRGMEANPHFASMAALRAHLG